MLFSCKPTFLEWLLPVKQIPRQNQVTVLRCGTVYMARLEKSILMLLSAIWTNNKYYLLFEGLLCGLD